MFFFIETESKYVWYGQSETVVTCHFSSHSRPPHNLYWIGQHKQCPHIICLHKLTRRPLFFSKIYFFDTSSPQNHAQPSKKKGIHLPSLKKNRPNLNEITPLLVFFSSPPQKKLKGYTTDVFFCFWNSYSFFKIKTQIILSCISKGLVFLKMSHH